MTQTKKIKESFEDIDYILLEPLNGRFIDYDPEATTIDWKWYYGIINGIYRLLRKEEKYRLPRWFIRRDQVLLAKLKKKYLNHATKKTSG